ncbi:hypothetical protein N7450_011852 [Penicillium hetheringtonii]|uniref:Fungal-specific transcription factor domain-containing protein n=1 Tax=Penicillium hetheringtonii TaxID=911720 RepID=A0AAD6DAQ5_9EURO|nr:hypothetical protein N7450_011852 [Penicillium hetheringtonii]
MSTPGRVCARCARIVGDVPLINWKMNTNWNRNNDATVVNRAHVVNVRLGPLDDNQESRLGHICKPRSPTEYDATLMSTSRRPRASRSRGGCLSCKARFFIPESQPEDRPAGTDLVEVSDGDRMSTYSITPHDDDEFIATLFPHPLPEKNAVLLPTNRPLLSANPYLCSEEDRSLYNHYIHVVSRALSRSHDTHRNPFLSTLLPLAAASDAVTSVILSLSGCHWRRVYPSIWGCALKRQGKALTQVNRLLGDPDRHTIFEACATVLLLCLTELFDGTSRVWKWHLKAASAILKSPAFRSLVSTDEWTFCISLFHYLDSMSTISRCKPPLLHENDMSPRWSRANLRMLSMEYHPPYSTFSGMVNILANHRSKRVDELSEIGFRAAASQVESRIDEWRADHDRSAEPEPDTKRATVAFEWAIRLRLHQVVEGYDPAHEFVERAVVEILDAVQLVPYASSVEGCLLFPLVISGSSSVSIERRMIVKERLMVMENTLGFSHIQHARQLLETVWGGATNASDMNWAAVRYSQFPGVVFV